MEKKLEFLRALIAVLGNVSLSDAATWLEVEENAQNLLEEVAENEKGNG